MHRIAQNQHLALTINFIDMKIAIPTAHNEVDSHFGHCEYFTIVTVENGVASGKEIVESPAGCGCKSNIATTLMNMGVTVMLAGNIGEGAINVLAANNIKVIRGCQGNVDDVLKSHLAGKLVDSGSTCTHHGSDGHVCSH